MWVHGLPTHQLCFVVVFNISNASKSGDCLALKVTEKRKINPFKNTY